MCAAFAGQELQPACACLPLYAYIPCVLLSLGNSFTYQLVLGETDLQLHSTFDPKGQTTPMQLYQENYKKIMVREQCGKQLDGRSLLQGFTSLW